MTPLIAPRATVREFGHDPATLDRVAAEHSAALCERMRRVKERNEAEQRKEAA